MPSEQLNFGAAQQSGDQQLAGASPLAFNVLFDGAGAVRRRPGLSAWSGFPAAIPEPSQVDGISSFAGDLYYVTANRKIFKVSAGVASNMSLSGPDSFLDGTARPTFAETQFRLVIAGGAVPRKVERGGAQAALLGGSPPNATQIAAMSSRVLLNDLTSTTTAGRIRYSGPGSAGNETWSALGFTSAEARPDALVALRDNANEAFAWGETTLQVFSPDPSLIFVPGRSINRGCSAASSVIRIDESFAWLDDQTQFVISDGRSMEVLSDAIAGTLDALATVSDCWGFRMNLDQFDVSTWVMPSDGRAFAFQKAGGWSQWSGWTDGQGHTTFPARSHYYWPEERAHLVGLADGSIAQLDPLAYDDLGSRIKAEVTTGFVNHETDAIKHCDVLRFKFKRGQATTTEPFVMLSWRDGLGAFCAPRRIGLGVVGDYVFTKELRTLGGYRARQWKLEFSDACDFVLAGAEETFTVGGSN